MTVFAVGDSIAVGCGGVAGVHRTYATSGMPISQMGAHFARAKAEAKAGDVIILSASYNSGFGGADHDTMKAFINELPEGVHVRILGVREQWSAADKTIPGSYGARLSGHMERRNNDLRRIAQETGATFVEEAITVSNGLPGGEIHGNYPGIVRAALKDIPAASLAAPAAGATTTTQPDQQRADAAAQEGEKSWIDKIIQFFTNLFQSIFGGNKVDNPDNPPEPASASASDTQAPAQQPAIAPNVQEQARNAAAGADFNPATNNGAVAAPAATNAPSASR
jgi:hypothetical protein